MFYPIAAVTQAISDSDIVKSLAIIDVLMTIAPCKKVVEDVAIMIVKTNIISSSKLRKHLGRELGSDESKTSDTLASGSAL